MVRDTRSAGKIINRIDDTSLKKTLNGEKDIAECNSGKVDTPGGRRSSRDTSSSGCSVPSTQSLCNLKHPERGTSPLASPGVRKSGRLENRNTPSSLRKSDTGKNIVFSTSSLKLSGKVSFSGERRKKEKNIQAVIMDSGKVQVEVESVCRKRKKMTGRAFRKRFQRQYPVDIVSDNAVAIERLDNLCEDATIIDNVVDELPDGNGFKDSHTIKNLDPVESESSTLLGRSQDCDVLSDCGAKCTHPEDVDSAMDGPGKLSASSPIMDNDAHAPPMRNVLEDSTSGLEPISSTCSANSEDSPVNIEAGPVATPPTPESENHGLSVICVLCSKRKRVSVDSPENELCSCGTPREIVCGLVAFEGRGDRGSAATLESPLTLGYTERDLPREPYSDNHQMDSHVNACANCSNSLCCGGEKGSKRCSRLIVNGESSRFLEYWLPVQISKHQLEQYCATLLSNSIPLRSCSKNDNCGTLQETLRTVKKCCAHPYLVDSSPQDRCIAEGHLAKEVLDIGVEASGKLQLLDRMIAEIRARGSRVLILFQLIVGSRKASTGDILDDFLRQRFGENTYERVQASVTSSKKQAAVNRFNSEELGKFIFLLENRACSATIKLLSLDNIIIFDSDWNPVNDFRALQKLSIGSGVEKIKVFRLYSSFTFEERALILAKKNVNVENSLQTLSRARIDSLLMWGASYLFSKLEEYHIESTSARYVSFGKLLLTDVMREFQSVLSESYTNMDSTSIISEVKLHDGVYKANNKLLGEANVEVKDGVEAHVFWKNILDRQIPQWKHIEAPTSRNRKRVQYFDSLPGKQYTRDDDAGKKRKRVGNGNADLAFVQAEIDVHQATHMDVPYEGTITQTPSLGKTAVTSNDNANDEQKSLYNLLEGEIVKLCHILKLSEDVTHMAKRFLEYIIKNHHVISDPPEIVQSFQISLCWSASSMLKQKVDRGGSLELARQSLSYQCTEEQASSVYSKLRSLKKMYLQWSDNSIDSVRESLLAEENTGEPSITSNKKTELEFLLHQKKAMSELYGNKTRIRAEKFCHRRLKKLRQEHKKKIQEFHEIWDTKRQKLVEGHKLDAAFIRSLHDEGSVRTEKLKHCDSAFAKKIEEHNLLREAKLKALEAEQLAARNEEKQSAACWLAGANICLDEINVSDGVHLLGSNHEEESRCSFTDGNILFDAANVAPISNQHEENENATKSISMQPMDVSPPNVSVGVPADAVQCNDTIETTSTLLNSDSQNEVVEPLNKDVPEKMPETIPKEIVLQEGEPHSSAEPHEKNVSTVGNEQISDTEVSAIALAESVKSTPSSVHLQDQDTPAVEEQSIAHVTNPEHVDVNPGVTAQVETVTSTESPIESQHKDAPATENQTHLLIETPVEPIIEQPVQSSPAVENQSVLFSEWSEGSPSCHQIAQLPNQGALQLGVGTSYPTPQQAAFHLAQVFLPEPLQSEYENLSKEKEYLKKSHEDTASQMKSEREKEIEKAIQEIRSKYEVKLREAELEFKLKNKALDRSQNKVLMNKNLAQSFRSKCSDGRSASNARAVHQGLNRHSNVQQVNHQLLARLQQRHQQQQPPPPRQQPPPPRQPVWSSTLQISPRPLEQSHVQQQQQAILHHSLRPPPPVSNVVPPAVQTVPPLPLEQSHIQQQHLPPAVQTVPPPPRFSSTPTKPLIINSHTPSGNPSNSVNIRAQPPHLQRSRPAAAAVCTPPHLQAGPQIPTSQQISILESSEAVGGFPVHVNSSLSAIELLMNVDQQSSTTPPLTESPSNLGITVVDANPPPTTWAVAEKSNGVVCLSDDE